MGTTTQDTESRIAAGVVAVGHAEALAYRSAGFEVQELADPWDWLALGEAACAEAREQGLITPDSPARQELLAWCQGRAVLVPQRAGLTANHQEAIALLAVALRVQSGAIKVVHAFWR